MKEVELLLSYCRTLVNNFFPLQKSWLFFRMSFLFDKLNASPYHLLILNLGFSTAYILELSNCQVCPTCDYDYIATQDYEIHS